MSGKSAAEMDDITPITIEDLPRLGVNSKSQLFFDNRLLITGRRFYFTVPQKLLALLTAMAAISTIATGVNNASVFLCSRDIHWLTCPVAALHDLGHTAPSQK